MSGQNVPKKDHVCYVHWICAAWDFGILPTEDTFKLFANWEHIFRKYPCQGSPVYQAF